MVEKLIEKATLSRRIENYRWKTKNPKPLENKGFWALVRVFITDLT